MFTYLYIICAWLHIEGQTYKHLAYTSQMQKEIASFRQNARIFLKINVFSNWVPHEKLHRNTAAEYEQVTNQ